MKICAYVVIGITVLFLLLILSSRNRINIAVEVIKQASAALAQMKSLVFFPLIPLIITVGYISFWIVVALYIYSVANKVWFLFFNVDIHFFNI